MRRHHVSVFGLGHGLATALCLLLGYAVIIGFFIGWDRLSPNQQWLVVGVPVAIGILWLAWRAYKEQL